MGNPIFRPYIRQCAIPVFDGLLPEPYNTQICRLLFSLAHWHGMAKLRMQHDLTLKHMDAVTTSLGDQLREFCQTSSSDFATRELQREANARVRRENRKKTANFHSVTTEDSTSASGAQNARRAKTLNLNTYKTHALGDYTATIRQYGTTDSYSTAPVYLLSFDNACTR